MNKKIFPVILTIVFLIIFFIFFKGLQNSNIYTPNVNLNKGIPVFESKSLDDNLINSDEVINEKKYYLNLRSSLDENYIPIKSHFENYVYNLDINTLKEIIILASFFKSIYIYI